MDILRVDDLEVRYGDLVAVKGVSFAVAPGEIFGLLGPNGAGKTSMLKAVEGLLQPAAGRIRILGIDPTRDPYHARACLGVQLQATAFQPDLTVRELFGLYARLYGVRLTAAELDARLEGAGLGECRNRRPAKLSGGQRHRLALQIALVHRPPLLVLDEPTTGLDPQSRRALWAYVEDERAAGRSALLTTHSMEEAAALADRIAIMVRGRLAALGAPRALVAQFADDPRVLRLAHGEPTLEDVFLALAGSEE